MSFWNESERPDPLLRLLEIGKTEAGKLRIRDEVMQLLVENANSLAYKLGMRRYAGLPWYEEQCKEVLARHEALKALLPAPRGPKTFVEYVREKREEMELNPPAA